MADILTGTVSIEKAPDDATPVDLTAGVYEIVLEPVATEEEVAKGIAEFARQADYYVAAKEGEGTRDVAVAASYYGEAGAAAAKYLPTVSVPKPKPELLGLEKHMVLDTETTGTTPMDSRLVMVSMWMLDQPKTAIITFADENEEELIKEVCDWINQMAPEYIVAWHTTFDVLFLTTRMMKYQVACKALYTAKFYDVMDISKWGSERHIGTTQKAGSLEDWAVYLFGESKPYDIETCLAEYEKGNLVPFYVRNRWDVATEGDVYKLYKYVLLQSEYEEAPASLKAIVGTQRQAVGTVDVQCNVCKQLNVYECANEQQVCFICGALLPVPKECLK